jgi:RNA polymerase sigma-70 factor (ECF subfamily)
MAEGASIVINGFGNFSDIVPTRYGHADLSRPGRRKAVPLATSAEQDADRRRSTLMAAAQAGDTAAYTALLRECLPLVRDAVRRQGMPPDRVEDAVQEVLLTLHCVRHTYDPARRFTPWLRSIARHRVIDLLRYHGLRGRVETHAPEAYEAFPDPDLAPDQSIGRRAEAERLRAHIARLPDAQRQAVEDVVLAERSVAEAASLTQRTPIALKVNLHRALKTLRARMA